MKDNKEKLTKEVEENENVEVEETSLSTIQGFGALGKRTETKCNIYTNITDQKKIFNLENTCDYKINDCKGELIRVKEVLVKRIEKPLDEPEVDENGEIIKDKEIKLITILIDDNNKSYVTASKMFTMQMMNYINMFGLQSIEKGLEIKIIERAVKNSSNKAFKI